MNLKPAHKIGLSLCVTLTLLALLWAAGTALAQGPDGDIALSAPNGGSMTWSFTYQGVLDDNGQAANGLYDFIITIWDSSSMGQQIAGTQTLSAQTVENGVFSFNLFPNIPIQKVFNGDERWLQIEVRPADTGTYTTLPRQAIAGAPYAWSLRPGAIISGTRSVNNFGDAILNVENKSFDSTSTQSAIWARAASGSAIIGEGGNVGVKGLSLWGTAIIGEATHGTGGSFSSGDSYGVRAQASGSDNWQYAGYFSANGGYGVYAYSSNNDGVVGSGQDGLKGYGSNNGVVGSTSKSDGNYGLYTTDNLYSNNYHLTGAVMQVVHNSGSEPLERGDLVVIAGMGANPEADGPPIIQVRKADAAHSSGVLGVVDAAYDEAWMNGETPSDTHKNGDQRINQGDYLTIVVQGPAQVKASALNGALTPGELLASTDLAGYASSAIKVDSSGAGKIPQGTVIGKTLEPLEKGEQGLIYIFVTLQ